MILCFINMNEIEIMIALHQKSNKALLEVLKNYVKNKNN